MQTAKITSKKKGWKILKNTSKEHEGEGSEVSEENKKNNQKKESEPLSSPSNSLPYTSRDINKAHDANNLKSPVLEAPARLQR